jgi:uncharacterized protein GlcG (DUF336 family)
MKRHLACAAAALLIAAGQPVAGNAADLVSTQKLAWRVAAALATDAVDICERRGCSVTASVVDAAGLEQALVKSDAAHPQSVTIAYRKAYTAMAYGGLFRMNSTGEIAAALPQLAAGPLNTVPGVLIVAGGVTIRSGETVIGGLGVSGAPGGDKDEACARTALQNIIERLQPKQ